VTEAFAPGRANLIGEHTDYNGGLALPFAIAQGVRVRVEPLGGARIEATAVDLDEADAFDVAAPEPNEGWRAFVRGTVAELRRAGVDVGGARLEIAGDVPLGSGLSSSAALGVALALALGGGGFEPIALARLCSRVEHDWVGAETGLLDQLASLSGRADTAVRIDFAALALEPVALELGGWRLAVLDSGAAHDLSTGGYNERRAECREAAARLGVEYLAAADLDAAARLPDPLDRRVRHVLEEDERVDAAVAALRAHDVAALGPLLDASHASLRDLYDASVDEVEATVDRCRVAGAAGARMMGGGFGGTVLALFPPGVEPPSGAEDVRPSAGAFVDGPGSVGAR
jgi:galactokinase